MSTRPFVSLDVFSFYTLCNLNARGVHSSTAKKTQPVKLGGAWVHGLWENVVYVSADKGRKHQAFGTDVFVVKGINLRILIPRVSS